MTKASKQLNIMKSLQYRLDRETLEVIYMSFIRPIMEYGSEVWDGCAQADKKLLEDLQLAAARIVTGAMKTTPSEKLYEETGWEKLSDRRERSKRIMMYKIVHKLTPSYLYTALPNVPTPVDNPRPSRSSSNLRSCSEIPSFDSRTVFFEKSFFLPLSNYGIYLRWKLETIDSSSI